MTPALAGTRDRSWTWVGRLPHISTGISSLWFFAALVLGYLVLSFGYHVYFDIQIGHHLSPLFGRTATRLYLPDSDLYTHLYSTTDLSLSRVVDDILHEDDPNIYGISAIGATLNAAEIDPMWVNMALVVASGWFLRSILRRHGVVSVAALSVLFLNPATIYYSQTVTKEIVVLFATAGFMNLLDAEWRWWLLVGLVPCIVLTMFLRLQVGIPLVLALVMVKARTNTIRRWFILIFFGLCLVLTSLYSSGVMHSGEADSYRRDQPGQSGLGDIIDTGLRQVPLAGLLLVPIRALQNTMEPFPATRFEDSAPGTINVYTIVLLVSFVMSWYFVVEFAMVTYRFLAGTLGDDVRYHRVVCATLLVWMTAASNSWVHNRYMFNIVPVIPVLAVIGRHRSGVADGVGGHRARQRVLTWVGWGAVMTFYGLLFARAYVTGEL
jgi:hypothetical protein